MLRLEDCLALCDLSEGEVLAIAQHEHIPEIAAAELGNYLVHTPDGERWIKAMIKDDIASAAARGDEARTLALKLLLRNFILEHPGCDERLRRDGHGSNAVALDLPPIPDPDTGTVPFEGLDRALHAILGRSSLF